MDDVSTAVRLEVRRRLKAAGLRQRDVAARLSVSPQHVSRMLVGRSTMSLEWAARILEVCGRELVVITRGGASDESTEDDLTRLRDQIAEAIRGYDWDHGVRTNPEISEHQRGEADAVMAIVRFVTSGYAATTREYRERAEQAEAELEAARFQIERRTRQRDQAREARSHFLNRALEAEAERDALQAKHESHCREEERTYTDLEQEFVRVAAERDALKAATDRVRRLCEMTIASSIRMQAIDQAHDTLAAVDHPTDATKGS